MFGLGQKLTLESFQLWSVRTFLRDFPVLSQNKAMFKNLNNYYLANTCLFKLNNRNKEICEICSK